MGTASDLDDQFFDFHLDNPQVYDELVRLAREAKTAGKHRIGMRMIWETARWHLWMKTKGRGDFLLDNNLHSRYARLIMACEPDLVGAFAVRSLRSNNA